MVRHEASRWNEWKTPSLLQGGDEPLGRSVPGMQREGETAGPERYWCGARQAAKRPGLAQREHGESNRSGVQPTPDFS